MTKTRAIALATNAYPLLLLYWYKLFKEKFYDEVDKLYIIVSSPVHPSAWHAMKKIMVDKKVQIMETNMDWPTSLNTGIRHVQEETIFIPHDDTFIFKPGLLNTYFDLVERTGKVVTPITPIFQPKDIIEELIVKKYGDRMPFDCPETGQRGFSFYCNMFFVDRNLLSKTSMDFGKFTCDIGEHCELLDWTPLSQPWSADTNFLLCLELLKYGAEFYGIKKMEIAEIYNANDPLLTLMRMVTRKKGIFAADNGWVHLQTMAYHIGGLYFDLGRREEIESITGGPVKRIIHNEQAFWEKPAYYWSLIFKLAWLKEFLSVCKYDSMQSYCAHTDDEIDYIINQVKIKREVLEYVQSAFHKLIWS